MAKKSKKRSKQTPTQTAWKKSGSAFQRKLYSCTLIVAPMDPKAPKRDAQWAASCGRLMSKTFWTDRGVSFTPDGAKRAVEQSVKLHKGKKR